MKKLYYPLVFFFLFASALFPAIYLWKLTSFFIGPFHSEKIYRPTDIPVYDITFQDDLGAILKGWLVPGEKGKGVVLILHGYTRNRNILLRRARFLHREGYSVMLFDFQGHGESSGDYVTFGYRESHNVKAAVSLLRQKYPGEKLAIIGTSMGAVSVFADGKAAQADAYVLESPFLILSRYFSVQLSDFYGVKSPVLFFFFKTLLDMRVGFDVDHFVPREGLKTLTGPLLLVAAREDRFITLPEIQSFYIFAPKPKELWIIDGMDHSDYSHTVSDQYEKKVLAFLQMYLRGSGVWEQQKHLRDRGQ